MTIARKAGSLISKLILFALFVPMFVYELLMFMMGKRKFSKRQYELEFDHGYNPPTYGGKQTEPRHPDVWAYALEKSYDEFANDLRLAALMGIIFRFQESGTTEEFDLILSDHVSSLRRQPDAPGNTLPIRLWNPANVANFLDEYYKKLGFGDFTHYYIKEKGSTDEWRIIKLGTIDFKPQPNARSIDYYSEYARITPVQFANYSVTGDRTSVTKMRFYTTDDASLVGKTVRRLCNFAMSVVSAMFDERDAAVVISRLEVSQPQPFEYVLHSARMKLDWEISRPYWSEPDQVFAHFTIEKV
jgi:hypothetical protein